MQSEREIQIKEFIGQTAWAGSTISPVRKDTSVRDYYRLSKDGKSAIFMDARPPLENTDMYEFMRNKLHKIGLRVPEIYATDHKHGLVVMEDFGDERAFELVTEQKVYLSELYTSLVDALVHKCKADPKLALEDSVAYSDEYWMFRVEQFLIHYMPHVEGREVSKDARDEFLGLYKEKIINAHGLDDVLLHGDYGVNNLYYFPKEPGLDKVGIIDFQDMTDARGNMMGSPAFDLVFLLEDVRVEIPDELEEKMKAKFIVEAGIKDFEEFNREYATIAVAQATKCLGLFSRFGYGNGRKEYLPFIPYCLRNLNKHLPNEEFKDIRNWFIKNKIAI